MLDRPKAIFFDPDRKRWPRVRNSAFIGSLLLCLLLIFSLVTILVNPVLQTLKLPSSSALPGVAHLRPAPLPSVVLPASARQRALKQAEERLRAEKHRTTLPIVTHAATTTNLVPDRAKHIGFFVNWDDSSLTSLKQNLANLDVVIGEWLHLADATGTIRLDDPSREQEAVSYIRLHKPDTRIVALINNYSGTEWQSDTLAQMLASPESRGKVISWISDFIERRHYDGVSIDFENIPETSQANLLAFMEAAYPAFHAHGWTLSMNVPFDNDSFDYEALAQVTDQLFLMAYDEHWADGDPGPVASQDWFTSRLLRRKEQIPPEKMVVALGNYAYDWTEGDKGAQVKNFEEALLIAQESEGVVRLDRDTLNPTFEYSDESDHIHHVWLLDAVTAFNQVQFAKTLHPGGFALWRLGSEDPAFWNVFASSSASDLDRATSLQVVHYGYDLDYEGKGEILRLASAPRLGKRDIQFDPATQLITQEHYTVYPSPYVIDRYGEVKNKIALTFDDGPDPAYTGKILDILKQKQAPATFFIVGENGQANPDLLKREIAEGHEIGNHTFTHPNISDISHRQFALELSATQRLLESIVTRQTHLFRPPYAEDVEPDTPDQVQPLELATELGYITVGMLIDPGDWQRPGVDQIVQKTLQDAKRGTGNIVLLHDSGGDRVQTIEALPKIIDALRQNGFQLVLVSELLGKTRDEVMPLVPSDSRWVMLPDFMTFYLFQGVSVVLHLAFFIGIFLGILRVLFLSVLALRGYWRTRHRSSDTSYNPSTAVVIPAYNEEKVVARTVESLLESEHSSHFEVIVVDDGSTDRTLQVLRETFAQEPRVRVFSQLNSGKPAALNFGISQTQAEIVVALDADTIFTRDTIQKLVRHFVDPMVGAVAGNAKVGNRVNLLTRWQALEYITSQNIDRRAFEVLRAITVVPGAVGAWRRSCVVKAGGFEEDTLAEDADLTIKLQKLGFLIKYEEAAIALTEAPETFSGFVKQRFRWMFGTMQTAWKHRSMLFRPRYGWLGCFAIPNIFIFQVFFPLISPIMDLVFVISCISTLLDRYMHPLSFNPNNFEHILLYYALFVLIDFLLASFAFFLERKENPRLLFWLFFQRFLYRQLMYYVAIRAVIRAVRGSEVGWNKLDRTARISV